MKPCNDVIGVLLSIAVLQGCAYQSPQEQADAKIFGGEEVQDADDPIASSIVSIRINDIQQCSGFLIAKGVIATAAHCIIGQTYYLTFALANYAATADNSFNVNYDGNVIKHPGFNDNEKAFDKRDNDVALIFFDENRLSPKVRARYRPGSIATTDSDVEKFLSHEVMLAGYGENDTSAFAKSGLLGKARTVVQKFSGSSAGSRIMTETGGSAGKGDSGGPLYVLDAEGRPVFLGINVMAGAEDGYPEGVTVANSLAGYYDWIVNAIETKLGPGDHIIKAHIR